MPESTHHNEIPDRDLLLKYLQGKLSPSEQHRIEKLIHDNPMVRDALEGLEALDDRSIREDLDQLDKKITHRTSDEKNRRIPLLRIAAAFIFMVIAGGIIYLSINILDTQNQKQELSLNQPERLDTTADKDIQESGNEKEVEPPAESTSRDEDSAPGSPGITDAMKLDKKEAEESTGRSGAGASSVIPPQESESNIPAMPEAEKLVDKTDSETLVEEFDGDELYDEVVDKNEYERDALAEPEAVQEPVQFNEEIEMKDVQEISTGNRENKKTQSLQRSVNLRLETEETAPRPVTGFDRLYEYLQDSLKYPMAALQNEIEGNVILSFTIDEDSIPENITVNKSLGYGCDEEAIRLIREGPAWIPYRLNGKTMEENVTLSINFSKDN